MSPSYSLLSLLCGVSLLLSTTAQADEPAISDQLATTDWSSERFPLALTLHSESLGFVPAKAHPAISLGTEHAYYRGRRYELLQMVEIGYLHHAHMLRGPHVDTGLMNRFKLGLGLYAELGLKAGVSWYTYPGSTYTVDDNGEWGTGGNQGIVSIRVVPAALIGVDLRQHTGIPLKLIVRYDQTAMFPLSWGQETPVLGQSVLGAGVVVSTDLKSWRRK